VGSETAQLIIREVHQDFKRVTAASMANSQITPL
jgi:hypothetical protein